MHRLTLLSVLVAALTVTDGRGDSGTDPFDNPILPGSYPDPSICYADGAWYLVNSSFEYFPGLPVHRSTDLVNWELIGYALHRASQVSGAVNLVDVPADGGIHAPSIRCRNGRFYVVTTNVYAPPGPGAETQFVNFVVSATDPAGPWSDPQVIDGAPGIDPDLFFDDDGRAWYVGNRAPADPAFEGEGEIWLQEIDPDGWRLVGERHALWRGACGGTWAEGPHIYKRDGRYYLLIAEGGTGLNHAVMIAVSDRITGPYVSNPRNPILTSRHLGYDHWVNSTGHADLVELPDGRWYAVLLGVRNQSQRRSNMGRETFLAPVRWEREPQEWKTMRHEWPVISPHTGRVEPRYAAPFANTRQRPRAGLRDDFSEPDLGLHWNFRRVPRAAGHSLAERAGFLRLYADRAFAPRTRTSFTGIRQTAGAFRVETRMLFQPERNGSEAGLALVQKDRHYASLTVRRVDDEMRIGVTLHDRDGARRLGERALDDYRGDVRLRATADEHGLRLEYRLSDSDDASPVTHLPPDALVSRGYTGAYLGLYAAAESGDGADHADFDWLQYDPGPE